MKMDKAQGLTVLTVGAVLLAAWTVRPEAAATPVHTASVTGTARFLRVSAGADPTAASGETIYKAKCQACHQASREGMPPTFPSLIDVTKRKTDDEIKAQIKAGKGIMPAFPDLTDDDLNSLVLFLKTPPPAKDKPSSIMAGEI